MANNKPTWPPSSDERAILELQLKEKERREEDHREQEYREQELREQELREREQRAQMELLRQALSAREKELDEFRNNLVSREELIDRRIAQDKKKLEQRERALREEWETRAQGVLEQERTLASRAEEIDRKLEEERLRVEDKRKEYVEGLRQIEAMQHTLEQERLRLTQEAQQALQDNSRRFVGSALKVLGDKEAHFHSIGLWWAVGGATALLIGVIIAGLTMISSADAYHQASAAGIGYYFFHLFRGLVVVGICGALARYAFIFSNSYMHESLKVGERAHAIRFGEFYLDTYGTNAQWEQVKEAFAHWNIIGQSAFSKQENTAVDQAVAGLAEKVLDKAVAVVSAAAKKPANGD